MGFARWGLVVVASSSCLVFAALASLGNAADTPPRVLGFERMAAAGASDPVSPGNLLLGELNCTSCHRADESLSQWIQRKAAPILDSVGTRVQPQYLQKFLADPQTTKPGTTMPNVLAGMPEAERSAVVEALVHFLATTGNVAHANPAKLAVNRGDQLYHSVGCLACHDPRSEPAAQPLATSIPLGTPSRKYTLPGLTQFLTDPLAIRPSGRMPHLNLSPAEARDVASFLLNDLDIVSGLQYAYYEGEWEKLPDFSKLTPVAVGDADSFDLGVARRRDHFALRFEGTINISKEGDYLFLMGSDDGSRLLIDGKVVVVNDGIHSFEQKRKRQKMVVGQHFIVIEYFDNEGEETLQVEFEGPGEQQAPLATLLTTPTVDKGNAKPLDVFLVDAAKAAKGREHFAALGCAACHTLNVSGSPVVATNRTKSLAELSTQGGCLDERSLSTPRYGLSERQRKAVTAALNSSKTAQPLAPAEFVQQTLTRFNCVACHDRDKQGGVEETRNAYFQTDMPEMGDEGRIPPSLTGVGAKLTGAWLRTLFDKGADDRTYMLTRMPKFALENVGALPDALAQADAASVKPAPTISIADEHQRRVKAAGRRLVGAQGFSCIKCHTFAGQKSSGIQAISLTTMTERLRPEWFHHYLQSPLTYRPGTRMPTPFPDGQTTLPGVLDGTVNGQIAAMWTYLTDRDNALFPVGLVTGKIELVAFDEPVVYRNFIEGAGTRAIGVGYPEKLNLAFDAENVCLALLWHGGFIDAARHWSARGAGFEKPLGDNVLRLPTGVPLAKLADDKAAWPDVSAKELGYRFQGYKLSDKKQPVFLYSWNGVQIEDQPWPVGEQDLYAMLRTLKIRGPRESDKVWLRAARAESIRDESQGVYRIDNRWMLHVKAAGRPVVRQMDGDFELLVPVLSSGKLVEINLTYDW